MEELDALLTRELNEREILQGKRLSPETELYLRKEYTEATMSVAQIDINSSDTETRIMNAIRRAYDGGRRALLLELLTDSESAKIELQQLAANNGS